MRGFGCRRSDSVDCIENHRIDQAAVRLSGKQCHKRVQRESLIVVDSNIIPGILNCAEPVQSIARIRRSSHQDCITIDVNFLHLYRRSERFRPFA